MTAVTTGRRFLIVDDDADDTEIFSEALAAIEPTAVLYKAGDGKEAFDLLSSSSIDTPEVIFMDLNMPVLDGWQCLQLLKNHGALSQIPIIIHTTSSLPADRIAAKEMGANCFVTKETNFRKLQGMLKVVCNKLDSAEVATICQAIHSYLGAA